MRQIGELEWAEDEIHWADQEEAPIEVPPCDIGVLIKDLGCSPTWVLMGSP